MFDNTKTSILAVIAHPDDLEMMAGATVAKLIHSGNEVHVLTISNGVWTSPEGIIMRNSDEAIEEERNVAKYLGYTVDNLNYPAMDLAHEDKLVCEVLTRIAKYNTDTILCPWENDLHHDHEVVSRIAISASRKIPRVLMGQINSYLNHTFTPNIFVDITDFWHLKIEALKRYKSQWKRASKEYYKFADVMSRYYGNIIGVERAEAFISRKYLIP